MTRDLTDKCPRDMVDVKGYERFRRMCHQPQVWEIDWQSSSEIPVPGAIPESGRTDWTMHMGRKRTCGHAGEKGCRSTLHIGCFSNQLRLLASARTESKQAPEERIENWRVEVWHPLLLCCLSSLGNPLSLGEVQDPAPRMQHC